MPNDFYNAIQQIRRNRAQEPDTPQGIQTPELDKATGNAAQSAPALQISPRWKTQGQSQQNPRGMETYSPIMLAMQNPNAAIPTEQQWNAQQNVGQTQTQPTQTQSTGSPGSRPGNNSHQRRTSTQAVNLAGETAGAKDQLESISGQGNNSLTNRARVTNSELSGMGWNFTPEQTAITPTQTYSFNGTTANFTPVQTEDKTGALVRVFSPDELQEYADAVLSGRRKDDLHLMVGQTFSDAGNAERAAEEIREAQREYFDPANYGTAGQRAEAYLRGLTSRGVRWSGAEDLPQAARDLYMQGEDTAAFVENIPAMAGAFQDSFLGNLFRTNGEVQGVASTDPESVQKAGRAGQMGALAVSSGIQNAAAGTAKAVQMVEDLATGGKWNDPLTRQVLADRDAFAAKIEDETKDWTPGQKEAYGYAIEAFRMLPNIAMSWATGGASAAAEGLGIAQQAAPWSTAATQFITDLATNPAFYETALEVTGNSYEQALADMAERGMEPDPKRAAAYAVTNGILNAVLEVGGTQELTVGNKAFAESLWDAVMSVPEEMLEEIEQGAVETALGMVQLGKDGKIVSVTDKDAIFSLARAVEEGKGAAVLSTFFGGANLATNAAMGGYARNSQNPRAAEDQQMQEFQQTQQEALTPIAEAVLGNGNAQTETREATPGTNPRAEEAVQMEADRQRAELEREYKRRFDAFYAATRSRDMGYDYRGELDWLKQAEQQIGEDRAGQIAVGAITPGTDPRAERDAQREAEEARRREDPKARETAWREFFRQGPNQQTQTRTEEGGQSSQTIETAERGQTEGITSEDVRRQQEEAARQRAEAEPPVIETGERTPAQEPALNTPQAPESADATEGQAGTSPIAEALLQRQNQPQENQNARVSPRDFEALQEEYNRRLDAFNEANDRGDPDYNYREEARWLDQAQRTIQQNQAGYYAALAEERRTSKKKKGAVSEGYGTPENHIAARNADDVGDLTVKAFQFDHPELHPYFLEAAREAIDESATELIHGPIVHRNSQKETFSSEDTKNPLIRYLRRYGLTRKDMYDALDNIIRDMGSENTADSKRAELFLHNRLMNGYMKKNGTVVPPNQAYIDALLKIPGGQDVQWQNDRNAFEFGLIDLSEDEAAAELQRWDAEHPRPSTQSTQQEQNTPEQEQIPQTTQEQTGQAQQTTPAETEPTQPPAPPTPPQGPPPQNTGTQQTGTNPFQNQEQNQQGGRTGIQPVDRGADQNGDLTGTKVSQTAETVRGAKPTTADFAALMDREKENGAYRYFPITNDESVNRAIETIKDKGWDKALFDWEKDVYKGVAGDQMTSIGALLYNNAVNSGNTALASEILSYYVSLGQSTARGLQAFRILKDMDPSTRLYGMLGGVREMSEKYTHDPDAIQIDSDMAERYRTAATEEERNAVFDEIMDDLARQITEKRAWDVSIKEMWTALRYLNMLGNLRTQARNIGSNTAAAGAFTAKYYVQNALERIAQKATHGAYQANTAVNVGEYMDAARQDAKAMEDYVLGEQKYGDTQSPTSELTRRAEDKHRIFAINTKSEKLNKAVNTLLWVPEGHRLGTQWAMNKGDTLFSLPRYARVLAGYVKAHGMDAATFSGIINGTIEATTEQSRMLDDARAFATNEAQEATFRDTNKLSSWVSKVGRRKDTWSPIKILSEGTSPFRKTPVNVAIRAEEFSPLGWFNTLVLEAERRLGKGNVQLSDVLNSASKSLTGTGIFLLGMLLRKLKWITGSEDDDKQKKFNELQGWQEWALNLPNGKNITIDWSTPNSIPLFMGAALMDAIDENGFNLDAFKDAIPGISQVMLKQSMLQGINDALNTVKRDYNSNNAIEPLVVQGALSYLFQGITSTLGGQLERITEDRRYTTWRDPESKGTWGTLKYQLDRATAKIPGLDRNQIEYVDAWGRPEYTGTLGERAFENAISPGYSSKYDSTEVDDELQRLYDAGMSNVFPQTTAASEKIPTYDSHGRKDGERYMTKDELVRYQKVRGQTSLEMVKDLMDSNIYDSMTDEARAAAISEIYSYARYEAARAVERTVPNSYGDITRTSNPAAYIGMQKAFSTATSDKYNRDYDAVDDLMEQYGRMPMDVRKLLGEKVDGLGKVYEASKAGINSKTYYETTDAVKAIPSAGEGDSPLTWQKVEYIGNLSSMPEKQKDFFMKQYFEGGTVTKYENCRDQGYRPQDIAEYYKLTRTITGDDKNGDGKADKNSKRDKVIAAARDYGFSQAQAEYLWTIWG